jgi:hypothetical protein
VGIWKLVAVMIIVSIAVQLYDRFKRGSSRGGGRDDA